MKLLSGPSILAMFIVKLPLKIEVLAGEWHKLPLKLLKRSLKVEKSSCKMEAANGIQKTIAEGTIETLTSVRISSLK